MPSNSRMIFFKFRMGIQKIAKINSGRVKKRFGVVVGLNILAVMSSPRTFVGDPSPPNLSSNVFIGETCGDMAWIPAYDPRE
jgi:hypothetical protein